jgi:phosphotransferase system HPr (HPr) family protein
MYVISTTVGIEKGLHARPSAKIVEYVLQKEGTHAWVEFPEERSSASARSIMELLMLGVQHGKTVLVKADGLEEEETALYIVELLKNFKI